MPDHFFDEIDRDEIDLFDTDDEQGVREALANWLGYAPSPFQVGVAFDKMQRIRGLATALGYTLTTQRLREGTRLVSRAALRDVRGRFISRGAQRITTFLQEQGF